MEEKIIPKVLVVEDAKMSGVSLRQFLAELGCNSVFVETGEECLEILEKEKPDLILLDLVLKEMNGLDVIKEIDKMNLLTTYPIIIISSVDSMDLAGACLTIGAADVLVRPFNLILLRARILGCLKLHLLEIVFQNSEKKNILDEAKRLISHEINNPLTVIQANLDLLLMALEKGEERVTVIKEYLLKVVLAGNIIEEKMVLLQKLDHEALSVMNPSKGIVGIKDILEAHTLPKNEFFHWRKAFELNLKTIDSHHKKIVEYINELYIGKMTGREKDVLRQTIENLVNYAKFHFDYEEKLFHENQYENENKHKERHLEFFNDLNFFKEEFEKDVFGLSDDMMNFLKDWLLKHILVEDKKYLEYFLKNGYE